MKTPEHTNRPKSRRLPVPTKRQVETTPNVVRSKSRQVETTANVVRSKSNVEFPEPDAVGLSNYFRETAEYNRRRYAETSDCAVPRPWFARMVDAVFPYAIVLILVATLL